MKYVFIIWSIFATSFIGFTLYNFKKSQEGSERNDEQMYNLMMNQQSRIDCRIKAGWDSYGIEDIVRCDNLADELYPY